VNCIANCAVQCYYNNYNSVSHGIDDNMPSVFSFSC